MSVSGDNARHVRKEDRPHMLALRAWALVALISGLLTLPFLAVLADPAPHSSGFTRDFALGLGFAGISIAGLQFALTARIKPLLQPYGADIVLVFHRYLSWGLAAVVISHFGILYIWFHDELGVLNPLEAELHMTAGRIALACFILLVATSELRRHVGFDYLWWRRLHVGLALTGFGAAIWHVLGAGHFTQEGFSRALWIAVTFAWLGLVFWTRLLRPWGQLRNPWRVIENRNEGDGVRTLVLSPEGQPLSGWRPGQFAWLTIGTSPFALREHPFTISSAPDKGQKLRFSIKPLGDDSKRLSATAPGTKAYVDGPYGAFSIDRKADAEGFVMIAGGIGITPILANLKALEERNDRRKIILLYANDSWEEIAFRQDLDRIGQTVDLRTIHVIRAPPKKMPGRPPTQYEIREGLIDRVLLGDVLSPQTRDWPHMLCGPPPMLRAVQKALRGMGVHPARIFSEVFELV